MFASKLRCDAARLQRLIDDGLSDSEQAELARHLDVCPRCRQQLEGLAADETWWHQTREFLSGLTEEVTSKLAGPDAVDTVSLDFLDPSDNPAMLGRLGEYEVLEIIGRGGMGVVLKGYDHDLNRYVAIKVLAPQWASSGAARKRFAREGQAAAAVVHQHVVAIHSVNATHRLPYLVMPFVAGESLQQRLDRVGPLEITEILRIGFQVAEGLAAAHAQGLVHRDIKPANILLEKNVDRVLLTDFSLARAVDDASVTRSGVIAGTPQYMSPEQAKGEPVDHRSDLFSLGSVLYAMCTGHPPFRAESTLAILRRICESEPRPLREINPSVPVWLWAVIAALLNKHAAERIGSAKHLAEILSGCLAHVQQPTMVPLPKSVPQHRFRLRGRWWIWIAVPIASMLSIATWICWQPAQEVSQASVVTQTDAFPATTPEGPVQTPVSGSDSGTNGAWEDRLTPDVLELRLGIDHLEQELKANGI
ncbi:MAG: prkC 10 [Planctomycetaceae bacterium]|nr:prkC 10 [Planctomycetaceae bacterium]